MRRLPFGGQRALWLAILLVCDLSAALQRLPLQLPGNCFYADDIFVSNG